MTGKLDKKLCTIKPDWTQWKKQAMAKLDIVYVNIVHIYNKFSHFFLFVVQVYLTMRCTILNVLMIGVLLSVVTDCETFISVCSK